MLVSAIRRHAQKFLVMSALSVRQHARYDARQVPPRPGNDALSPIEIKLEERFEHQIATLVSQRDRALRSERVNAIANDLSVEERSFADLVRDCKNEIWIAQLEFNGQWTEARQHIRDRLGDLEQFKREHLLRRDAIYHSVVLAIGVLALAFVTETLANAALFADVSSWGYSGGAMYAMALSLPNVALGFAAGFFGLRGGYHIRPPVRWLAGMVSVGTFTCAVLWNFYVAHLRSRAELRADTGQPLSLSDWHEAGAQMLAQPTAMFASPQGMLLMALGLAVFAVAVHDGLDLVADRYPGFAAVDRRVRNAIIAAETLKWRFFHQLTRLTQRGINHIAKRADAVEDKAGKGLRILDSSRSIIAGFDQRAADHLWVHRATVREYHSLNRACRGEHGIPHRFDAPLSAAAVLPIYDWPAMRDKIRAVALAAAHAADEATVTLLDHRLRIMRDIDSQTLNVPAQPTLPPPPFSRPATETA